MIAGGAGSNTLAVGIFPLTALGVGAVGGRRGRDIDESPQGPFSLPYMLDRGPMGKVGKSNTQILALHQASTIRLLIRKPRVVIQSSSLGRGAEGVS